MKGIHSLKFLRNPACHVIVISRIPLLCEGLRVMISQESADASLMSLSSLLDLRKSQLESINVVVADLSESTSNIHELLNTITELQHHSRHLYWIFLLPPSLIDIAVERMFTLRTSLMSICEPVENLVEQIFNCEERYSYISPALLQEKSRFQPSGNETCETHLTFSERSVLRLLGKGWRINQIATLLKKSNKTISAQKKSAMRRLAVDNDVALFAWIVSDRGMRELNLLSLRSELEKPGANVQVTDLHDYH